MKLQKTKISSRTVSALEVEKDTGSGVRVYLTGSKIKAPWVVESVLVSVFDIA